jgi:hypothetical protein
VSHDHSSRRSHAGADFTVIGHSAWRPSAHPLAHPRAAGAPYECRCPCEREEPARPRDCEGRRQFRRVVAGSDAEERVAKMRFGVVGRLEVPMPGIETSMACRTMDLDPASMTMRYRVQRHRLLLPLRAGTYTEIAPTARTTIDGPGDISATETPWADDRATRSHPRRPATMGFRPTSVNSGHARAVR